MSLVECHDPDNIFDVVGPYINSRLPLTNLHWKSSTRPLRSIESLHVDLVRANDHGASGSALSKGSKAPTEDQDGFDPSDSAGEDRSKPDVSAPKGQRHQIPGLRQTPYLKLYLLRCDDKETYKTKTKDILKAWMKDNVPQNGSAGKTQDHHDAFDWLILHVVLPNTLAACEPRWSKNASSADQEAPKPNSGRWTGKASRTILERLRTDFNPSSKSAPDRIAQIRVGTDNVPSHLYPPELPTGATAFNETSQDREGAFDDLISKMKTVILASFDLRVRQYEDDIKEKENQQSLPGWNFCTFFVLKEGLARAFESVGLMDDALAVYDELDAGLEACLYSRAVGQDIDQATSFLSFTPELHDELVAARNGQARQENETQALNVDRPLPLRSVVKDYRNMILSSAISIFDFRRYIFARQMSLLIRLANIRSLHYPTHENGTASAQDLPSQRESQAAVGTAHNAIALAELCRRSVQFVPSIARILRADLRAGFSAEGADLDEAETIIDKAVFSMTFSVAQQILDETAISDVAETLSGHDVDVTDLSKRSDHRSRRRLSVPNAPHSSSSIRGQTFGKQASVLYSQGLKNITPTKNPELSNAAAYRAELLLLQRRVLQSTGRHFGFHVDHGERNSNAASEIEGATPSDTTSPNAVPIFGTPPLKQALSSSEEFAELYEGLTDRAACHYAAANRVKSAEKLTVDIAKLKLADGDYAAAALYFNQVIPSFSRQSWSSVEASILHLYAECLKALHRKDEYVRVALALLTKAAELKGSNSGYKSTQRTRSIRRQQKLHAGGNDNSLVSRNNLFADLVFFARDLPYDLSSPLLSYFADLEINTSYELFDDRDGFKMGLKAQQLLADRVTFDRVTVKLVNPLDTQSREILMQNDEPFELGSGISQLWLESRTTAVGQFIVDKVTFQAGRLSFVHEPLAKGETPKLLISSTEGSNDSPRSAKSSTVLLYQRIGAFFADIQSSRITYIGKARAIDVTLDAGSNNIENAVLILRSATAGLRIHSGDAYIIDGEVTMVDKTQTGRIEIGPLAAGSKVRVQVPYELERNIAELLIRMEVHYTTAHGDFIFVTSPAIPIELPLDITVQDLFKQSFFYSKFLIQPQSLIPIHLMDAEMRGSEVYDVQALLQTFEPFIVFPRQPANVTYRISKKDPTNFPEPLPPGKSSLLLKVSYRSLQDDVFASVASKFEADIKESSFHHLHRLLVQTLRKSLHLYFPLKDYHSLTITGQVPLPAFETIFWADALEGLGESNRRALRQWLEQWHEDNATIKVKTPNNPDYADEHPVNQVLIDFEIPHLQYLHTVSVRLTDKFPMSHNKSTPVVRVGDILHAQLRARHTRCWDLQSSAAVLKDKSPENFTYEIRAEPTDWLIVGQQRATFTAAADETAPRVFDFCLVPVRTGNLLLPIVEVWPTRKQHDGVEAVPGGADAEPVSCQTDCTSVNRSVLVVEGMQSTTVAVGRGDDVTRGLALLGSEVADVETLGRGQ